MLGGPESAVFWILAWFDRLGGAYAPDDPVQVFQDATGAIVRIRVEGVVTFDDGARLEVAVELDRQLRCRSAFFEWFDPTGARDFGWHHHPERRDANHRHDPPDFQAEPADPPTLESVEAKLHA